MSDCQQLDPTPRTLVGQEPEDIVHDVLTAWEGDALPTLGQSVYAGAAHVDDEPDFCRSVGPSLTMVASFVANASGHRAFTSAQVPIGSTWPSRISRLSSPADS